MPRIEFNEKHEWIIFFCFAMVVGRMFWHDLFYVDVYTVVFFLLALLFLYKTELLEFIDENVESFNFGKDGFGATIRSAKKADRQVDELKTAVQDLPGEPAMSPGSDLPSEGMGTPKVAITNGAHRQYAGHILPSDQHAAAWKILHEDVDKLKSTLGDPTSSMLIEAIIHAWEKGTISEDTKKTLLAFEDTLRTMLQFSSFFSSDKVITMSYVVSKLIPRIQAESTRGN